MQASFCEATGNMSEDILQRYVCRVVCLHLYVHEGTREREKEMEKERGGGDANDNLGGRVCDRIRAHMNSAQSACKLKSLQ